MRKNYEMTEDDLKELMEACKPVPMIALQCGTQNSPQENANAAWDRLGKKMGFDGETVEPTGQGDRFFSALTTEEVKEKILLPKTPKAIKHDLGHGLELIVGSDGAWIHFDGGSKKAMFHVFNTFCDRDGVCSSAVREWLEGTAKEWQESLNTPEEIPGFEGTREALKDLTPQP